MRINRRIAIGRFEAYIGRRPHWEPAWQLSPITHGWGLWAGRWNVLVCWLPPLKVRRAQERQRIAQSFREVRRCRDARSKAVADAQARMRLCIERITKGRLFRVRPLGSVRRAAP
jgi:hypothetical protein